ncbi:hypothetical protein SAMN04489724_2140 [Algoriphagus locisalis]|uniref:Uncharacterized protein n=2 Tax=Algoriphagus locisalis TaxID=305507 RepID=A0A1I7AQV7_9BACT|nr:hypothetical protein SAMN04489724_2140 [Algoriphagus locisalis]
MTTVKEEFHKLIEEIEDENLIASYFELFLHLTKKKDGSLMQGLTNHEKSELLLSYIESHNNDNLVKHEQLYNEYSKWLEK